MRPHDGDGQPDLYEVVVSPGEDITGDDSITHSGTPLWSQSWFRIAIVVVVFVAALVAAYSLGRRSGDNNSEAGPSSPPSASSTPAPATTVIGPIISETGHLCGTARGGQLQLGVEVVNQSTTDAVTLNDVLVELPLGGLQLTGAVVGACGELEPAFRVRDFSLAPKTAAWLMMSFDVQVDCPQPLPVQLQLKYTVAGRITTVDLPGFADLGGIDYPGCETS